MKRLVLAVLFLLLFAPDFGVQAEEEACVHSWSVISTVPGSCTAEGRETRQCSLCGAETTSSLPRTEHNYAGAQWIVAIPATCTSPGLNIKNCVVCGGEPAGKETPATGHSEVTDPGQAASCTNGGISDGKHCSVCGVVTLAQQATPPRGHQMTRVAGVSPTCIEPGKADGETCADCGYTVEGAVIPAAGHKGKGDGNAKSPTCTETGLTESRHCAVCGISLSGRKTIAATGHQAETDAPKAPTAQENGCTAGAHCAVCGEIITVQETIPALKDFAEIWQLTERMQWAGDPDAAQAEWVEETLEISLPQKDEKIILGMAARADRTLTAFYIATAFEETPLPDWQDILQMENALTALETDANYGGFARASRALLMEMDAALTVDAADAWLAEIIRNSAETQTDFTSLFAAFVQGDMQLPLTEKNGCVCCLVSDGVNIVLMLHPIRND